MTLTTEERASAIEKLARTWCERPPEFQVAADATVMASGLPIRTVERQLLAVAASITARLIIDMLDEELSSHQLLDGWRRTGGNFRRALPPSNTLHLVSGTVPGLSIESCLWGLSIGGRHTVRPAHNDRVFAPFAEFAKRNSPELFASVDVVDTIEWGNIDGAVVYGSDDTIAHVRDMLGETAPIAMFGSREGIAVVTSHGMDLNPEWANAVAEDIARFSNAGCMTPRRLVVVGATEDVLDATRKLDDQLDRREELGLAREVAKRRIADTTMLAHVASIVGAPAVATPDPSTIAAAIDVLAVASFAELVDALHPPLHLQTATVVCAPDELDLLSESLALAGCTRICKAGSAHDPSSHWRHDGRGRIIDLVRFVDREL